VEVSCRLAELSDLCGVREKGKVAEGFLALAEGEPQCIGGGSRCDGVLCVEMCEKLEMVGTTKAGIVRRGVGGGKWLVELCLLMHIKLIYCYC
jgi:hypothetical protein